MELSSSCLSVGLIEAHGRVSLIARMTVENCFPLGSIISVAGSSFGYAAQVWDTDQNVLL